MENEFEIDVCKQVSRIASGPAARKNRIENARFIVNSEAAGTSGDKIDAKWLAVSDAQFCNNGDCEFSRSTGRQ